MTRRDQPLLSSRPRRGGFSLIELMIVITIIAILVGMLLVGVRGAIDRARVAEVVADMKNFESGIKQFEAEFGVQPPSYIVLYEHGGNASGPINWGVHAGNEQYRRASRALIKQMWPNFDFNDMGDSAAAPAAVSPLNPVAGNSKIDLNGNGNEDDVIVLNGAECLVFFLGGMQKTDTSSSPSTISTLGFSKSPSAPFTTVGGTRSGPFFEFDKSTRFVDSDSDQIYEYLDPIPGQTKAYQYLSSYGGQGYRPYGLDGVASTTADNEIMGTLMWVYTRTNGTSATSPGDPFNPKTFQIISAGFDGEFGVGGAVDPEKGVKDGLLYLPSGNTPATVSRAMPNTQYERDNITNFLGSELH